MSTRIDVPSGESGTVRVFATDLDKDQIEGFDVAAVLGASVLDAEQVELFDVSDLQGLGLTGFLEEGHGIPRTQLADMAAQLDTLKGVVLIVPSRAFRGEKQTLTPTAPLRLLGIFFEDRPQVNFEKLPSEAAQGNVNTEATPRPSNAAMSGRVAMIALLFLALLVAVMIWVAA